MMKKFWVLLSILTAMISGLFLYEAGTLLLWYHDYRQGLIILAAGIAEMICFMWTVRESFRKMMDKREQIPHMAKRHHKEEMLSGFAFGLALAGIVMYCMRFYNRWDILICSGLEFIANPVMLIIIWAMNKAQIREQDFRAQIMEKRIMWESYGYTVYDEETAGIAVNIMEARHSTLIAAEAILSLCMLTIIGLRSQKVWMTVSVVCELLMLLVMRTIFYVKAAKYMTNSLNAGNARSVLGFFAQYYDVAKYRGQSLSYGIQLNAVTALCDQEIYEDALKLLSDIKRPPRTEAYFQQYEWICREGLRDREGCIEVLGKLANAMMLLRGKNREKMQQIYNLFDNFTHRNYQEAIKLALIQEGLSDRQIKFRNKLIQDAENGILDIENGDA